MSQAQSRTTVAGCSLEDLCRGVKNYVCDASCLVGLEGIDVIAAKDELLTQLTNIFKEIEVQTDCKVKKFYIGKAIVKKRKSRGGPRSFVPFNPMDPLTWKKSGISSRWCAHRDKEYGKDGLVVLGAVTRDSVPKVCHGRVNQEQYAIALQQMILHHLMLIVGDDRLENESFLVSGADGGKSVAYAIYVTFTLEEQNSSEHGDFLRYSPSSSEPSPPPSYDQYNDDSVVDLQTYADNDSIQSDDDSLPPFPPISFSPLKQLEVSKKDNLANAMEIDKMTSPLSSNNQSTNSLSPSKIEARMEEDILLGLYDHSVVSPTQLSYKQVKRNSDIGTNESTANNKSTFTIHDQNTLKSNASLVSTSQQAGCSGSVLPILQVSASETNKRQPNAFTSRIVSSTPSTDVQETSSHIQQPVTVDLSLQNLPKSNESRQMSRKRSSSSMCKNANAKYTGPNVSQKTDLPQCSQQVPTNTSNVITSLPSYVAPSPKFKKIEESQAIYDPKTGNFIFITGMERSSMQLAMLKNTNQPLVSNSGASSHISLPKDNSSEVKAQPETVTTTAVHPSSLNKAQPTIMLLPVVLNSENSKLIAKKRPYTKVGLDANPSVSTVSQKKYVHVAGEKLPFSSTAQDVLMYATITKEMTNSVQTHPLTTHVDKSTISSVLQHKETIVHSSSTLKSFACSQHTARPGNFQDKLVGHHTTSTLPQSTNYSKAMASTSQISSGEPKLHALSSSVVKQNLIDPLATDNASPIISDKCGQNQKKTKKVTFRDPPIVSKKRNTSSALNRNEFREDNPKPQPASSKIFNDNIFNVELKKDSTLLPQPISRMEQPNVLTATLTSVQDHLPYDPDISNNGKETVKATKNKERYRHKHENAGPNATSCTYVPVIQSQLKDYTKK